MGNLELIEDHLVENDEARNRLETAYTSAGRGAELIRKLLSVSGSRIDIPKHVSLNYFLQGMEYLISQSLTVSISTKMLLDENIWTVKIDPSELEDTIINLSLNARDAMPDGGEIIFQTSNISIEKNNLSHYPQLTEGHFVKLTVRDSGTGMTPEVCKKATEPFYTTKATDQGTGLGLSMVQAFVYRCGGHLDIISEQGKGTEIGIYLPRAMEEIQNQPTIDHSADQKYGNETILVVDDEVSLVEIVVSHLQSLGYKTLTAHDSSQALKILKENPSIDLLFTDVIMPGEMDGYQLAATAQNRFPDLRVLVTSGFTHKHDEVISDDSSRKVLSFLSKPYDKVSLSSEVRATLDTKANA
jgi:CheY-like chemotaxis protein